MKSVVIALLLASTNAVSLKSTESSDLTQTGGPNTPAPGAAKGETRFVLPVHPGHKGLDLNTVEHCPDFNERFSLLNGVTKAVAYPNPGYNCNANYGLAQGGPGTGASKDGLYVPSKPPGHKGLDLNTIEHCPDFNERYSLLNGVTKAVAYPQPGYNCNANYGLVTRLAQGGPGTGASKDGLYVPSKPAGHKGLDLNTIEHCPDFNERFSLLNGVTKAVAYPQPGYNCNAAYGLVQAAGGPGTGGSKDGLYAPHAYTDKGTIGSLEHCPNFNERMTLLDGKTKAVSHPQTGFNCKLDH